ELVGGLVLVGQGCPGTGIKRPVAGVFRDQRFFHLWQSIHAGGQSTGRRTLNRFAGDERCRQPGGNQSARQTVRRSALGCGSSVGTVSLLRWAVVFDGHASLQRRIPNLDPATTIAAPKPDAIEIVVTGD